MKNKQNRKITVTVGIPCFNEGINIKQLLESVVSQKEKFFRLKEIIVLSDGSTDNTIAEAAKCTDKRLIIINSMTRKGKAVRINELCKKMSAEILVLLDGDIKITNKYIFSELIKPFLRNRHVGLVGGNPQVLPARTFVERGVNTTFHAYVPLRTLLRSGSNPYGCDGKIIALSRKFVKTVKIPKYMIGTDFFLYLHCLKIKSIFKHVPKAIVFYRSPSTLKDHIKQSIRFMSASYFHKKYFGEIAEHEYKIDPILLIRLLGKQFIRHPISSLYIFVVNKYCGIMAKINHNKISPKWDMITTTKQI